LGGLTVQIVSPWKFTKNPYDKINPASTLGKNTDHLLEKYYSYAKREIEKFKEGKVVF
jgi:crotonobetainyl-CoA:carnitine CoA-transferase CaiB-like acyl-CoA transferase